MQGNHFLQISAVSATVVIVGSMKERLVFGDEVLDMAKAKGRLGTAPHRDLGLGGASQ